MFKIQKQIVYAVLLLSILFFSACEGEESSTSDDSAVPAQGSQWDKMEWDKGKWE